MKKADQNVAPVDSKQIPIDQILIEFEKGCDEAIIRREGKRLILEPRKRQISVQNGIKPVSNAFPSVDITLFGDFRV